MTSRTSVNMVTTHLRYLTLHSVHDCVHIQAAVGEINAPGTPVTFTRCQFAGGINVPLAAFAPSIVTLS